MNYSTPAFKGNLNLGGDMYSIAKKVEEGKLKLAEVLEEITRELSDPKTNPVRRGKLEGLKKALNGEKVRL